MFCKGIAFILKSRPDYELRQRIDPILILNNISLKQIYYYHIKHRKEIDNAPKIFDFEKADTTAMDVKKILVLLSLIIPPERVQEVRDRYIEELRAHGITGVEFNHSDIKEYKLELITALIYNEEFWVTAAALYALYLGK